MTIWYFRFLIFTVVKRQQLNMLQMPLQRIVLSWCTFLRLWIFMSHCHLKIALLVMERWGCFPNFFTCHYFSSCSFICIWVWYYVIYGSFLPSSIMPCNKSFSSRISPFSLSCGVGWVWLETFFLLLFLLFCSKIIYFFSSVSLARICLIIVIVLNHVNVAGCHGMSWVQKQVTSQDLCWWCESPVTLLLLVCSFLCTLQSFEGSQLDPIFLPWYMQNMNFCAIISCLKLVCMLNLLESFLCAPALQHIVSFCSSCSLYWRDIGL